MLKCWTVEPAEAPTDRNTVAVAAITDAKMVLSMRVLLTLVFLLEPAHGGQCPARPGDRPVHESGEDDPPHGSADETEVTVLAIRHGQPEHLHESVQPEVDVRLES